MSGDQYKIYDQQGCYFITMTVVHWIDVFSRREYRDIIVESLNYCAENKGIRPIKAYFDFGLATKNWTNS